MTEHGFLVAVTREDEQMVAEVLAIARHNADLTSSALGDGAWVHGPEFIVQPSTNPRAAVEVGWYGRWEAA